MRQTLNLLDIANELMDKSADLDFMAWVLGRQAEDTPLSGTEAYGAARFAEWISDELKEIANRLQAEHSAAKRRQTGEPLAPDAA